MKNDSPLAILHDLETFRQLGSALYIAAHPDDENTELLAYLSRGRKYRTAYLSLTRGDGGQNVLGPEFGDKLGVARTQELLAARRVDGAHQFFSRAVDFGFSKDYKETLNNWDKQEVLSDVVRVIRQFRPDVVLTRFSPSPGGTHGHHTASTVLALEAFKLAGDRKAFPEQHLAPWQPKRIFWDVSRFQKDKNDGIDITKIDIGGKDDVSGETFFALAERSRGMHKTQGFDLFHMPGANDPRIESFKLLDGPAPKSDIMDDVDTSWNRVSGGSKIGKDVDQIIKDFSKDNVAASIPALLKLRAELKDVAPNDPTVEDRRALLDHILQECLGLKVETTIGNFSVVPGETMQLHHTASSHADTPVHWVSVRYPLISKTESVKNEILKTDKSYAYDSSEQLPPKAPLSQPYWLRAEGTPGMVRVDEPALIGTPENASPFPVENVFEIAGQTLVVTDQPVQLTTVGGVTIKRHVDVIAPIWLRFISEVALFAPGGSKEIEVEVTAARANTTGSLELDVPGAWSVSPAKQDFSLSKEGEHALFKFTLKAPKETAQAKITATALVNGQKYQSMREEITYAHIPPQLLQSTAKMRVSSFDLATRGHTIGYLPGAGDSIPLNMQEMGYQVKVLDDAHLTPESLHGLDAVVVGVRAANVRPQIEKEFETLFKYAEDGGNVIVQYNTTTELKTTKVAPYEVRISRDRCTDEKAKMTFLAPDHPAMNTPNKITQADFDGWVQERGLYFPDKWDEHFTPILACNDVGEAPLKGGLLVANYGKGHFVYTGLAFFRELPAGVPGAYRLFANLLSLGK